MREIEFRGKRKFDNTWIYGGYMKTARTNKIQIGGTSRFCTVYPETLGQYIGLKDKNEANIFEGDILKSKHNANYYYVYWKDNRFFIEDVWGNLIKPIQRAITHFECEVIGNIHDNPELVEIKQNENN